MAFDEEQTTLSSAPHNAALSSFDRRAIEFTQLLQTLNKEMAADKAYSKACEAFDIMVEDADELLERGRELSRGNAFASHEPTGKERRG